MATVQANGISINYRFDGPPSGPVIMLSNSLASNLSMWDAQVSALVDAGFRVLRYDTRGQGQSEVASGPYSIALLKNDVVALLDALDLANVVFCGLSLGGMVGQKLATLHGERLSGLILCATSAYMAPASTWDQRIAAVRGGGMAAVVDATIDRWFTKAGQARLADEVAAVRAGILSTPVDGFCACGEAIRDMDQRESIRQVSAPTLVMVGRDDQGTPVSGSELIAERIVGARLEVLNDAAHFVNVEQAARLNALLVEFAVQHRPGA